MPLDITEYRALAADGLGNVIPAGQEPAQTVQQIAIGGASVASAAFGDATKFVRIHADANCRVEFRSTGPAVDPVAAATSQRMPAGATEVFGVRPGHKVAVITST